MIHARREVFGEGPMIMLISRLMPKVSEKVLTLKATASEIPFYSNQEISLCYSPCMAGRKSKLSFNRWQREVRLYPDKITKIELFGLWKGIFTRTAQGVVIDIPDVQLNKDCSRI